MLLVPFSISTTHCPPFHKPPALCHVRLAPLVISPCTSLLHLTHLMHPDSQLLFLHLDLFVGFTLSWPATHPRSTFTATSEPPKRTKRTLKAAVHAHKNKSRRPSRRSSCAPLPGPPQTIPVLVRASSLTSHYRQTLRSFNPLRVSYHS
jgi:hypothetical protein